MSVDRPDSCRRIASDNQSERFEGFSFIELLIVVAIIAIIAAVAIPGLLRGRMAGNESAAIADMRMALARGEASAFDARVTDASGKGTAHATLQVWPLQGGIPAKLLVADENGSARLTGLSDGLYQVFAVSPDQTSFGKEVVAIRSDSQTTLNLGLTVTPVHVSPRPSSPAVPSPSQPPKPLPTQSPTTALDSVMRAAASGRPILKAPSQMALGAWESVEARVRPDEYVSKMRESLKRDGWSIAENTMPFPETFRLSAKLFPRDADDFRIDPRSSPIQAISSDLPPTWHWRVQATAGGVKELTLQIELLTPDGIPLGLPSLTHTVRVEVLRVSSLWWLFRNGVAAALPTVQTLLVGAVGAALTLWVKELWARRRTRTGTPSATPEAEGDDSD